MSDFITNIQYWQWWVLAIIFLTLEIFAPGAVFIWFSVSAAIMGVILLLVPDLIWQWQISIFGALSLLTIIAWRQYRKKC